MRIVFEKGIIGDGRIDHFTIGLIGTEDDAGISVLINEIVADVDAVSGLVVVLAAYGKPCQVLVTDIPFHVDPLAPVYVNAAIRSHGRYAVMNNVILYITVTGKVHIIRRACPGIMTCHINAYVPDMMHDVAFYQEVLHVACQCKPFTVAGIAAEYFIVAYKDLAVGSSRSTYYHQGIGIV